MADNKTKPTNVTVQAFLAKVDSQKRADSQTLIEMMRDISGHEPVMWGPSIIGFDTYHYKYDTGREGDVGAIGFSPRKANLTIYIYEGFGNHGDLLARLGKHTTSVSCLYIKKLADVDLDVLRELVARSYHHLKSENAKPNTVDEYESTVPDAARKHFKHLRTLVREVLPQAQEVISYAIVAYKVDERRPPVYISGWRDHVALYPVPRDENLRNDLEPYIKGKGTLWFGLDKPLPAELIKAAVLANIERR